MSKHVYLGVRTDTNDIIYMTPDSRTLSTYVLGKTGMGKSTLLQHIAVQDIHAGEGVCVIDPHGDLVEDILACVPYERRHDVIILDPGDPQYAFGLNPFFCDDPDFTDQRADAFVDALASLAEFAEVFKAGTRMRDILQQLAITFIVNKGTLTETPYFFYNKDFRQKYYPALASTYPAVLDFWRQFDKLPLRDKRELTESSLNKLRRFQIHRNLRTIFGQIETTVDFSAAMDENKIILVKLNEAMVGPENAALLGAFIMYELFIACIGRSLKPQTERKPYHIIADEFHLYMSKIFPRLQTGSRKFGVDTVVAHQVRAQLPYDLKATTKNVGNLVVFSVISDDAQELTHEFYVEIPDEIITQDKQIYEPTVRPLSAPAAGEAGPLIHTLNRLITEYQRNAEIKRERDRLTEERERQSYQLRKDVADANYSEERAWHQKNQSEESFYNSVAAPLEISYGLPPIRETVLAPITADPWRASANPSTIADYLRQLINEYLYARMRGLNPPVPNLGELGEGVTDHLKTLGNIVASQPIVAPTGQFETVQTGIKQGSTTEYQARATQGIIHQSQYSALVKTKEGRVWREYMVDILPPPIPFSQRHAAARDEMIKKAKPKLNTREGTVEVVEDIVEPVEDVLGYMEAVGEAGGDYAFSYDVLPQIRVYLDNVEAQFNRDWADWKQYKQWESVYEHLEPMKRMQEVRHALNELIRAHMVLARARNKDKYNSNPKEGKRAQYWYNKLDKSLTLYQMGMIGGEETPRLHSYKENTYVYSLSNFAQTAGTNLWDHKEFWDRKPAVRQQEKVYLVDYPNLDKEQLLRTGAGLIEYITTYSLNHYYMERAQVDRDILKRVNPASIIGDAPPVQSTIPGTTDATDYETR